MYQTATKDKKDQSSTGYYKFNMNLLPKKTTDRSKSRSNWRRNNRFLDKQPENIVQTPASNSFDENKIDLSEEDNEEFDDESHQTSQSLLEQMSPPPAPTQHITNKNKSGTLGGKPKNQDFMENQSPPPIHMKMTVDSRRAKRISGLCVALEFNILELSKKFYEVLPEYEMNQSGEFIVFQNTAIDKYLLIFDFGVMICWNIPELEEDALFKKLSPFMVSTYQDQLEKDILQFVYGETAKIAEGRVILTTKTVEEKISHSYAMAQSLKLSIYEREVDISIEGTKNIPKSLAERGQIDLNKKEISQMIGNLFMLRNSVNLQSDMLDTPEYFWDIDKWEETYLSSRKYFDIDQRLEVLNNRLDIIKELYDMLNEELHNQHASKLEWIVIWLIVIEVVIEVVWNIILKEILQIQ